MKHKKSEKRSMFFNASVSLEELSENEMFKVKGGTSDDGEMLEEVIVVGVIPDDDEEEEEEEEEEPEPEDPWEEPDYWDWDGDGYGDDNTTNPNTPGDAVADPGPWQRDQDGKLIKTPTGETLEKDYGKYNISYNEVIIKAPDGTEVTAFEVTKVVNNETGETLLDIPDNFKSNCSGYAFAGGEVWLFDPQSTDSNEISVFENMLDDSDYYTNVSKDDANMAVIWWTDKETGERFIAHSAEVNEDGTYDQKNEYGSEEKNVNDEKFTDGHIPDPNFYDYEIEYYKKNY